MCCLRDLQDGFEGGLPERTRAAMIGEHLKWTKAFPQPGLQQQLATMATKNVGDGRDLLVVSSWFMGERESQRMWDEYAPFSDGVAILSTIERLERAILAKQEFTTIGRVKYVDFSTHDMGIYHGHQADERALLKRLEYSHECEIRIVTMNLVCPGCLNADGSPPTATQLAGPGMYNPNRPGLYLQVDLNVLVESVVTNPRATQWFHDLVSRLCRRYGVRSTVKRSTMSR